MQQQQQRQSVAVFDVGSCSTRIGFAGEEAPRVVSPTVVGVPRHRGVLGSLLQHHSDDYAGDDALEREGILKLSRPVQDRRVVSFEGLEHILHDALYTWLPVIPSETPLMWVEATGTPRKDRERLCEVLFESFDIPLLGITSAAAATVYSTGRTTGLVLDSGEGCTTINAVWEGYILQHALHVSHGAGRVLTDRLLAFLRGKGYALSTPRDRDIVESMKRSLCYVAADAAQEVVKLQKKKELVCYVLPDEQRIYLHESQFMIPELLFTPSGDETDNDYNNSNINSSRCGGGWAEAVTQVVESAPAFTQSHLYANIVLGGGNTMFPGIEERLQHDVAALNAGSRRSVNCIAFPDRDTAAWIGGSVAASMPTFLSTCLARKDYLEKGAALMHAKV
ncbi:putative actin-like protein [Trypanosoma grayi]|uniref:putative actin-like protein n=1 Tax=Trypanosoma grayi TaxID=71804 RepID=UPI0004F427D3|nr:putative actin-like protein [Trypanosoma grayi]KEG09790.1 putative actin-like protein [Trypanosoma grayi]